MISRPSTLATLLLATLWMQPASEAKSLSELRILYVGSERSTEFIAFLKPQFHQVEGRTTENFNFTNAEPFDVVLLDWPHGEEVHSLTEPASPLGQRDVWHKPTVVLGIAGRNLASAWKTKGASGCSCLPSLAYELRDHEIFERPFKIERKMRRIPTPKEFRGKVHESEIEVLSLVDNSQLPWRPGWCSESDDFALHPDIEVFCGGINPQSPKAAGLWRQGNLLHFGFEQSPMEMNDQGRQLLLNSIAYISRFTEDRPIATSTAVASDSVLGQVANSRKALNLWLINNQNNLEEIKDILSPDLQVKLSRLDRDKIADWLNLNASFLHPDRTRRIALDEDLATLGVPFDQPEFFVKSIEGLCAGGGSAERARRVLERYVPAGPKQGSSNAWATWWSENKRYAFTLDSGDAVWYVDALAKKRGIPTKELRGPKRATVF